MKIIFCEDPLRARKVDEVYQPEAEALTAQGLPYALINYETLVNANNPVQAVTRVPPIDPPVLGIYRGWMLRPAQYAALYAALAEKGVQLINTPEAYQHCHYLPESYAVIEPYTPKSVWLPVAGEVQMDAVMAALAPFGARPVIVKDFVKSQKHYWAEACFIPSATDRPAVERVVKRFLELQGDSLNVGLVFREFVELDPLPTHTKSRLPLSTEFRVFVLDGEPLYLTQYWEEGDYAPVTPPLADFSAVMRSVQSRFFTMDIGKRPDGQWMIVELGDAQVAGLPDTVNIPAFYQTLAERLRAKGANHLASTPTTP